MSFYSERTTVTNVGGPPPKQQEEKVYLRFNNFAFLPIEIDQGVTSPKFESIGKQWTATLYPGGTSASRALFPDNGVAVSLTLCDTNDEIDVLYTIYLREGTHTQGVDGPICGGTHDASFAGCNMTHEWSGSIKRSEILDLTNGYHLIDGVLTVEVWIRPDLGVDCSGGTFLGYEPFIPQNPFVQNMQKMFPFMDEESSDVVFEVQDKNHPNGGVRFPAHRIVLKACSPTLAYLCDNNKHSAFVPIKDVEPSIFKQILRYVYGYSVLFKEMKCRPKEYINAADRYGVVNLKLQAEAWYCKVTQIKINNVMEILHYAESKSLALLKEAAMKFILGNVQDIVSKISLDEFPASSQSYRDILTAVMMGNTVTNGNVTDIKAMPVNSLRMALHEIGLDDIDGTREMLVTELESEILTKDEIGARLYPLVHEIQPRLAGKITGMLLDMDNSELLRLIENHEELEAKIEEALQLLEAHRADLLG